MSTDRSNPLRVLVVEDSDDDALLLVRQLEGAGYRVARERVDTHAALTRALDRQSWDIVFSDFSMPRFNGMQALEIVREHDQDVPFIIVSGTIGEERAVQLMKSGAQDYLLKGNIRRLLPVVERELKEAALRRAHRHAQEHIRRLAYYDWLTDLPNRHRLAEDVQQRLGRTPPVALMLINLMDLGEINRTLGHSKGDELIREAAGRLRGLRFGDRHLYHLQGGEFAVLLETGERQQVEAVARDILAALTPHYTSAGFNIHIGTRVGIVLSPGHAVDASVLLQRADLAAMFAKREEKAYAWYEPERDPSSPQRLALLADLHDALGTDQLFPVFQPKVQCRSGAITGAEVLLRWRHPEHGLITPDTFIAMAERSGLIDELTCNVLARTLEHVESWRGRGWVRPVAVNLSAKSLLNEQVMAGILRAAAGEHGGESKIEIEITETALMRDPDQAMGALRRLHEAGIRIYIDDFGTGFSSLGYLKKLPIHAIKIDKSFVLDLARSADSEAIVRSTIGLAHSLGLKVVAEGVEDRATWERLVAYGCDEGQGYYFTVPLSAEEFEARIVAA